MYVFKKQLCFLVTPNIWTVLYVIGHQPLERWIKTCQGRNNRVTPAAQAALLLTQSEEALKKKIQQRATTTNQWNCEMIWLWVHLIIMAENRLYVEAKDSLTVEVHLFRHILEENKFCVIWFIFIKYSGEQMIKTGSLVVCLPVKARRITFYILYFFRFLQYSILYRRF